MSNSSKPRRMKVTVVEDLESSRTEDLLKVADVLISKLREQAKTKLQIFDFTTTMDVYDVCQITGLSYDQYNKDYIESLLQDVVDAMKSFWMEAYNNHLKQKQKEKIEQLCEENNKKINQIL